MSRDDLLDVAQLLAEAEAESDEQAACWDPADVDLDSCANPGLAARVLENEDCDREAVLAQLRAEPDAEVGSPWRLS